METEANQSAREESPAPRKQLRKRAKPPRKAFPKYCGPHNTSGKGYVWEGRRPHYFTGRHNSPESLEEYRKYCVALQTERAHSTPLDEIIILEIFSQFATDRLPKVPQSEANHFRTIIRVLSPVFGNDLAKDFGPLKLQKAREIFSQRVVKSGQGQRKKKSTVKSLSDSSSEQIDQGGEIEQKPPKPWSRTHVNAMTKRLIRLFKWAVSVEIFPGKNWLEMTTISPLKKGESVARETEPIRPADKDHYEATRKAASPPVAAMMGIHWLTGTRSSNICDMRSCDIDMTGDVWIYVPAKHKTAWKKRNLFIVLGPQSQAILQPFIARKQPDEYLFSPRESAEWKSGQRWENRKTPKWDSALKRRGKVNQRIGVKYTKWTYRQAIHHAAKIAGVPEFNPHQLRHALGTRIRKQFGVEASQVALGHASMTATQIYAERDMELAMKVAREMG